MKALSKYILGLGIILSLFAGQGIVAHAVETDYSLLAPLPLTGVDSGPSKSITPSAYVSGIVKLAISLAAVLAVLMIIMAGFKYVTVENAYGKSTAKEDIKNALVGLFLAIAAYTILTLINPTLTNLSFSITPTKESSGLNPSGYCAGKLEQQGNQVVCVSPLDKDDPTKCNGEIRGDKCLEVTGGGTLPTGNPAAGCERCTPLHTSINQKAPGSGCLAPGPCVVRPELGTQLLALSNELKQAGIDWQVTEMLPATATHVSDCHKPNNAKSGYCVDAALRNISPRNMIIFMININQKVGPSFQWETKSDSLRDQRRNEIKKYLTENYAEFKLSKEQGLETAKELGSKIKTIGHASGEHVHINYTGTNDFDE